MTIQVLCFSGVIRWMKWLNYRYSDAAKMISLWILLMPSENLFSRSVLPILLAAEHICLNSSSSRRKIRINEPSYTSVILHICENFAPWHHAYTTSINSGLNFFTYSSSSMFILHSLATFAMRRAVSCISRNGPDNSSCMRAGFSTRSSNTKQLRSDTVCSTVRSLKTFWKTISVNNNSSPVLISHATRPFISTTSDEEVNPSLTLKRW